MIVRASLVVSGDGAPIANGAVRVEGERIVEIGPNHEVTPGKEQIVDLDGFALLPGLINAHCHLDYTCLRGKIPPPRSFADWIGAINAEKAKLTEADYLQSIANGFREAQRFGTTSIVNLEAFPALIGRAQSTPQRTWWCPELIDVTAPGRSEQMVSGAMACLRGGENKRGGFGLAPHALFTASSELYRRCQERASAEGLILTTHLAESREEMAMFRRGDGPLFEFLRSFGRDESDCNHVTPLEVFLQLIRDSSTSLHSAQNDMKARWLVAHLNEVSESDFDLLKRLRKKFSVAHCPRSHRYFGHSTFAFARLTEMGFNICLATDSLASNSDLSLFAEMREFQKSHPDIPAEELFKMVTVNPAKALGRSAELGKIAPGFLADMIALPVNTPANLYEEIVAFKSEVSWTMIRGEVV